MSWHDSAHWLAENQARIRLARAGEWLDQTACRAIPATVFFPERGQDERPAKRICQSCPVATQCLEYALEAGEKFGIWGGTSERQRRTMRRERRLMHSSVDAATGHNDVGPMTEPEKATPHDETPVQEDQPLQETKECAK